MISSLFFRSFTVILVFVLVGLDLAGGTDPVIDRENALVTVPTESGKYYIVQRTADLAQGFEDGEFFLGDDMERLFDFDLLTADSDFLRITIADETAPFDIDGDGIDDLFEMQFSSILDLFDGSDGFIDSDGDGRSNLWEYEFGFDPSVDDVLTTFSSSPFDGADGVAVTHETVLRFTRPLLYEPNTFNIQVTAGGQPLRTQLFTSTDRKTVTVFYPDELPGSSQVRLTISGSNLKDANDNALDFDSNGLAGGVGLVEFSTLSLSSLEGTSVIGRVFASELGSDGSEAPLSGVKVSVDGREDELFAITDEFGDFRLEPVPVGRFFVHIDGKLAGGDIPDGAYYPLVGKAWESVAGAETYVGEIYLPLVSAGTLTQISMTEITVVEFPDAVLAANPELMGVQLQVPAGALISQQGAVSGSVGIAPVDPDRLPGALPEGLRFPLVITVQSDGAGNFDTPIPACFPNLPDPETGETLAPGEKSALWSFDHDEGEWRIVGSMTVNEDGTLVCTDPGVGILAPGWHGTSPGVEGENGDIEEEEEEPCEAGPIEIAHRDGGLVIFRVSTPGFSGQVKWAAPGALPEEAVGNVLNVRYCEAGTYNVTAYLVKKGAHEPCTSRSYEIIITEEDVVPELSEIFTFIDPELEGSGGVGIYYATSSVPGFWGWTVEGSGFAYSSISEADDFKSSFFTVNFCEEGTYTVSCVFLDVYCENAIALEEDANVVISEVEAPEFEGNGIEGYLDPFDQVEHFAPVQAAVLGDVSGEWNWSIEPSVGVSLSHSSSFDRNSYTTISNAVLEFCETGTYQLTVTYEDEICGDIIQDTQTLVVVKAGNPGFTNGMGSYLDDLDAINGWTKIEASVKGNADGEWTWSVVPAEGVLFLNEEIYTDWLDSTTSEIIISFPEVGDYQLSVTYEDPNCGETVTVTQTLSVISTVPTGSSENAGPVVVSSIGGGALPSEQVRIFSETPGVRRSAAKLDSAIGQVSQAAVEDPTPSFVKAKGLFYYYLVNKRSGSVRRGKAGSKGAAHPRGIRMQANARYEEYILEASTLRVAHTSWKTPDSGSTFELPRFQLEVQDAFNDRDFDGLHDLAELIMGTNPDNPDTDDDGLLDGSEVLLGLNPNDGVLIGTGIVSTLELEGDTLDVCAVGDYAVTANGNAGVSIINIFNGLQPVFMARIDTAGTALAVACTEQYIAVADGDAGLAIIELRDPANESTLRYQVPLGSRAISVTAAAGLAYVGLEDGRIVVVEFVTGQIVGELDLGDPRVDDIAFGSDRLFAVTNTEFHSISLPQAAALILDHSVDNEATHGAGNRRYRLFAGEDYLLLTHTRGYNTYSVDFTGRPLRIALGQTAQFGWKQVVDTGTGLALAAVGANSTNDGFHDISIYNSSDLKITNQFQSTILTPGLATALTLSNGLAYVAATGQGLQVVNYLAPDVAGQAPTLSLSHNFLSGQAEENGLLVVKAAANDDVQVRHVDFFLDGERIASDGSYPYELRLRVPPLTEASTMSVSAVARDTGGNTSQTVVLDLSIVADATAPRIAWVTPSNGAEVGYDGTFSISVHFSESIDETSFDLSTVVKLFAAGVDGILDTEDDVALDISTLYNTESQTFIARPAVELLGGAYRVELEDGLLDLAGNAQPQSLSWTFSVPSPEVVSQSPGRDSVISPYGLERIHISINSAVSVSDLPAGAIQLERLIENADNEVVVGLIQTIVSFPRSVSLRLPSPLAPGDYKVSVVGIKNSTGSQIVPYSWEFQVRPVLPNASVPGPNQIVGNGLVQASLSFEAGLDASTLEGGIELHEGTPDGDNVLISNYSYNPTLNRVTVTFDAPLLGGYYYWVLKDSLKDFSGRSLGNPGDSYFFVVDSLPSIVKGRVVDEAGDPVPLARVSIQYLDVEGIERNELLDIGSNGVFKESIVSYGAATVTVRYEEIGGIALASVPVEMSSNPGGEVDFGDIAVLSFFAGDIDSGVGHTLWVDGDRVLHAVGYDDFGQLGNGSATGIQYGMVTIEDGANLWSNVAAGRNHSLGIQTDGTLWSWGGNELGQLGDGTQISENSPYMIGSGWSEISAGGWFSVGVKTDGTLWSWGYAPHGKVAGVKRTPILSPEQIGTDDDWAKVFAGTSHVLAVKTDGSLWAWGGNADGQLGDGTTESRSTPVQIGSDTHWLKIATSQFHTLGLKTDGSLWAWGRNRDMQLGDGSSESRSSPVRIGSGLDWFEVAVALGHSLVRKLDGSLWVIGGSHGYAVPQESDHSMPVQTSIGNATLVSRIGYVNNAGSFVYEGGGHGSYSNIQVSSSIDLYFGKNQYGKGITEIVLDFAGELDPSLVPGDFISFSRYTSSNASTVNIPFTARFTSVSSQIVLEFGGNPLSPTSQFSRYYLRYEEELIDVLGTSLNVSNNGVGFEVYAPQFTGHYPPDDPNDPLLLPFPDVDEVSVSSLATIDPLTVGSDALVVSQVGVDGLFRTGDDVVIAGVVSFNAAENRIVFTPDDPLPIGSYFANPSDDVRLESGARLGFYFEGKSYNYWNFEVNAGPVVVEPSDGDNFYYFGFSDVVGLPGLTIQLSHAPIDQATITPERVLVRSGTVDGAVLQYESIEYNPETHEIKIKFATPIVEGTYFIDLSTDISDTEGRGLIFPAPIQINVIEEFFGGG